MGRNRGVNERSYHWYCRTGEHNLNGPSHLGSKRFCAYFEPNHNISTSSSVHLSRSPILVASVFWGRTAAEHQKIIFKIPCQQCKTLFCNEWYIEEPIVWKFINAVQEQKKRWSKNMKWSPTDECLKDLLAAFVTSQFLDVLKTISWNHRNYFSFSNVFV